ncbi:MAG: hypothetical protein NC218_01450 [Acetobacter sp.]|nr:hypothetical protein [Acetobacter sp.]
MPTLAERRAQVAAAGGPNGGGDFIKFKVEGETKLLRFLFTDASAIESHKKFWDEDQKKWLYDDACPEGKGAYRITFNCVQYGPNGTNPTRCRWEISEYLYNEYLAPYIEKDTPASKNVWEIKVRRPGTMDISYVAFKVDGATELNYPIPEAPAQNSQNSAPASAPAAAPNYTAPTEQPAAQTQAPAAQAQQPAPAPAPAPAPTPAADPTPAPAAPKKSKYF